MNAHNIYVFFVKQISNVLVKKKTKQKKPLTRALSHASTELYNQSFDGVSLDVYIEASPETCTFPTCKGEEE